MQISWAIIYVYIAALFSLNIFSNISIAISPEDDTYYEDDIESIETDGLTQISGWSPSVPPGYTVYFTNASVCHHSVTDYYGIAAIFRFTSSTSTYYTIYYLLINGYSTSPYYGNLVWARTVSTSDTIDSVDCTYDNDNNVYVAWSSPPNPAQWARFTPSLTYGPYSIPETCGDLYSNSYMPELAWKQGDILVAAYKGYPNSCVLCFQSFNTLSGAALTFSDFWGGGGHPESWDVDYNDTDKFVVVFKYVYDGQDVDYGRLLLNDNGVLIENSWLPFESFLPAEESPDFAKLVYSNNDNNTYNRMILLTSNTSYWISNSGSLAGSEDSYNAYPSTYLAACEYWGEMTRIAHSFTDPELNNIKYKYEKHRHWYRTATDPMEVFNINSGYLPKACSSSNTYYDRELLLVSKSFLFSSYVYWNIEEEL